IITDNIGNDDITVEKGERLAQLVVAPVVYPTPKQVDWFEKESDRGAYGSTGE
ncbi:MAG: dUTP pyrophosphatase, partial [Staphylococcus epidermidis]|nr:dUTP pyrophosphatase [Staphylococcus epidermidis]